MAGAVMVELRRPVDLRVTRSPILLRSVLVEELGRIIAGFDAEAGLVALASSTRAELAGLRDRLSGGGSRG